MFLHVTDCTHRYQHFEGACWADVLMEIESVADLPDLCQLPAGTVHEAGLNQLGNVEAAAMRMRGLCAQVGAVAGTPHAVQAPPDNAPRHVLAPAQPPSLSLDAGEIAQPVGWLVVWIGQEPGTIEFNLARTLNGDLVEDGELGTLPLQAGVGYFLGRGAFGIESVGGGMKVAASIASSSNVSSTVLLCECFLDGSDVFLFLDGLQGVRGDLFSFAVEEFADYFKLVKILLAGSKPNLPVTAKEFWTYIATSKEYASSFNQQLAETSFDHFYVEFGQSSDEANCTFALIDAPELAGRTPDQDAFQLHIKDARDALETVAIFRNRKNNATLVCPAPVLGVEDVRRGGGCCCCDVAAFVRGSDALVAADFWKHVAVQVLQAIAKGPTWVSTAGQGVAWLHVRVGTDPKDYHATPLVKP
jgi:hypothetical protein